jgi:hypothetical protein
MIPEDERSTSLRNASKHLPDYTGSHSIIMCYFVTRAEHIIIISLPTEIRNVDIPSMKLYLTTALDANMCVPLN